MRRRARFDGSRGVRDTLALARSLHRPILIDIGAVWCHWCHVMDETTYADPRSRGGAEPRIRAGEGRYRRASRPRRVLSECGGATDRRRRLAADVFHDARRRAVFRGRISAAAAGQRTQRQRRRELLDAAVAEANLAGVRDRSRGTREARRKRPRRSSNPRRVENAPAQGGLEGLRAQILAGLAAVVRSRVRRIRIR